MRRVEVTAAVLVIGVAAWGVASQLASGPEIVAAPVRPIGLGEAVDPDVRLLDLQGHGVRIGDLFGTRATVLYSWSTTCPCIPFCEPEIERVAGRHGPDEGVRWVGIAGEPSDGPDEVRRTLAKLGAPYPVLLDPGHRLCGRVGFDRAAIVAVLDRNGYLRFRGNPSDSLRHPKRFFVEPALVAVLQGDRPEVPETPRFYGCEFAAAIACPDASPTGASPSE